MKYRNDGILFSLILPKQQNLAKLFKNTNWAHLIDSKEYLPSTFRGYTTIPATQYKDPSEQQKIVNKIANTILGAIPDLKRDDFAAFEWSINEITDNVLVHSNSSIGGFIQISTFQKSRKQVEFVVADSGLGIPKTLRDGKPEIKSDIDALDKAIKEGVTRDKSVGQGNGLFGSYQVCSQSKGAFEVNSGYARLSYTEKNGLHIANESIPYSGTLVSATIDFSIPHLLENSLKFRGKEFTPIDFVEHKYETGSSGEVIIKLIDEVQSFGSRVSGVPLRIKIKNIIQMNRINKVIIDLEGIPLVSSSFADEVFAKLFLDIGPMDFVNKIAIVNAMSTVKNLIDKSIIQRSLTGM